jgi:hypothetical protein
MELGKQINDVIMNLTHTLILNDVANKIYDKTYMQINHLVRSPIWGLVCDTIIPSIDNSINNK